MLSYNLMEDRNILLCIIQQQLSMFIFCIGMIMFTKVMDVRVASVKLERAKHGGQRRD